MANVYLQCGWCGEVHVHNCMELDSLESSGYCNLEGEELRLLRAVAEAAESHRRAPIGSSREEIMERKERMQALDAVLAAWREVDKGTSVRGSIGGV